MHPDRLRRSLATVALVVLLAASGCLAKQPGSSSAGGSTTGAAGFPAKAEGARIDARPDGAVLHWTGSAVAAEGTPIVDPRWIIPHTWSVVAEHAVTIPAGTTTIRGFLNWTGSGGLLFLLSDDTGQVWCGALAGVDDKEDCVTAIDPAPAEPLHWTLQVLAELSAPSPTPIPYTLDLVLSARALTHFGPPAASGASAPLQFAAPVRVGTGDEPSIAVAPDSTVYIAARVFESGGLWRSTDGHTFETVQTNEVPYCELSGHRPPDGAARDGATGADDSHLGCGDTDVSVSGSGTVYFASHWGAEAVATSHDAGLTWFSNPFGTGPQVPHTDRQWLAADGPMRAYLAYIDVPGIEGKFTNVARTDDGGLTWNSLGHALGNDCAIAGGIVTDSAHTVYMSGCTPAGPALGVSTDAGVTWTWRTAATVADQTLLFASVTVDAGGFAHLAWITPREGGGTDVWMASSKDQGRSWTPPSKVNQNDGTYVFAWATSGAAGKVGVTYFGTKVVGVPDHLLGDWYPIAAVTQDAFAATPVWAEATVSTDAVQYGPICVGGNGCANARNLGDFFQVQSGPDGKLHMAYADGSAGGGETLVRLIPSATVVYAEQTGGPDLGGPSLDKGRP